MSAAGRQLTKGHVGADEEDEADEGLDAGLVVADVVPDGREDQGEEEVEDDAACVVGVCVEMVSQARGEKRQQRHTWHVTPTPPRFASAFIGTHRREMANVLRYAEQKARQVRW